MKSISYILDAARMSADQCTALENLVQDGRGLPYSREFILYTSDNSLPEALQLPFSVPEIQLLRTADRSLPAMHRAVVTACSDWLVLTTVANVLSDDKLSIPFAVLKLDHGNVAIPAEQSSLQRKLGFQRLTALPFVAIRKQFAIDHLDLVSDPIDAIKYANRSLSLLRVDSLVQDYPDSMISNGYISRPYRGIAKHQAHTAINQGRVYLRNRKAEKLRNQVEPVSYTSDIPIFIICRDRVGPLLELVTWCEAEGLQNIIFIDNASSYPPLLAYLAKTKHEVIRLNANVGHTAPWDMGAIKLYAHGQPFVVTDPDVIPVSESHGAVEYFCKLLNDHPERTKVGFGLKIDDLPDSYALKDHVISWEKQFWVSVVEPDVYDAEIDTTFAVYRQNTPYTHGPGLRTGGRYVARHEPWYIDSAHVSEELQYYRDHADKTIGSWGTGIHELQDTYLTHKNKSELKLH